jgi:hypothetical protein
MVEFIVYCYHVMETFIRLIGMDMIKLVMEHKIRDFR